MKMTKEELLEEAKRRYPVGVIVEDIFTPWFQDVVHGYHYKEYSTGVIEVSNGEIGVRMWSNISKKEGQWAKVIPYPDVNPKNIQIEQLPDPIMTTDRIESNKQKIQELYGKRYVAINGYSGEFVGMDVDGYPIIQRRHNREIHKYHWNALTEVKREDLLEPKLQESKKGF